MHRLQNMPIVSTSVDSLADVNADHSLQCNKNLTKRSVFYEDR